MICQNEIQTLSLVNLESSPEDERAVSTTVTKTDSGKKVLTDTTRTKISGIYKIVNKINGKYYVGSSKDISLNCISGRWYRHKYDLNRNIHCNDHLQRAWHKYGESNFQFLLTEEVPKEQLLVIEQKYLDIAKQESDKCYNLMFDVGLGSPCKNERSKLKMRNRLIEYYKNHKHPNQGNHHSKETKEKISRSHKESGRYVGNKNPMFGKSHTKEIIDRIRKFNLGKFMGKESPSYDFTIYNFKNIITHDVFVGTQYDFKKKYKVGGSISNVINKRRKSYKGWLLT